MHAKPYITLNVPTEFDLSLKNRQTMAISIYSKTANLLDPKYRGQKLSPNDREEAEVFLIGELSSEGLESFQDFREKKGFFEMLEKKKISSSVLYWKCARSSLK